MRHCEWEDKAMQTLEQVVQEEVEKARAQGGSVDQGVLFRRVCNRLALAVTSEEADKIAALLQGVK